MDIVLFKHVNKLRECGSYPYALLVLYALVSLDKHLFYDYGEVFFLLLVLRFSEVHEYGNERSLTVGGKERDYLILYGLHAFSYLVAESSLDKGVQLVVRQLSVD